jgi:hypothetical protein
MFLVYSVYLQSNLTTTLTLLSCCEMWSHCWSWFGSPSSTHFLNWRSTSLNGRAKHIHGDACITLIWGCNLQACPNVLWSVEADWEPPVLAKSWIHRPHMSPWRKPQFRFTSLLVSQFPLLNLTNHAPTWSDCSFPCTIHIHSNQGTIALDFWSFSLVQRHSLGRPSCSGSAPFSHPFDHRSSGPHFLLSPASAPVPSGTGEVACGNR